MQELGSSLLIVETEALHVRVCTICTHGMSLLQCLLGEKSRKNPKPKFLGLYVLDVFLKSCARIEGALTLTDPFCGQASLTPKVKFAWLV